MTREEQKVPRKVYDISYALKRRPHLRYDWNENCDMEQSGANLSDVEVAAKVRMLMRTDLGHEAVCCMARDRIMALSKEIGRLTALVTEAN